MSSPGKAPIVEIDRVSKSYRRGPQSVEVLHEISFDIQDGDFLALMGPSGSGKSTLLNLIAGIDKADSGSIHVGGTDITTLSETELAYWRATHVGFIFQFYNLIPVLTAYENVEYPLLLIGMGSAERRKRTMAVLESVGLADKRDHRPNQLSGGQKQRVAIARALCGDARLLMLDDALSSVDSETEQEIFREILGIKGSRTIVFSTHRMASLSRCDRVLVLVGGRIAEEGTHDELLSRGGVYYDLYSRQMLTRELESAT